MRIQHCGVKLLSTICAAAIGAAALAIDDKPRVEQHSNEHLVASMPDDVESIMIWRYAALAAEESAMSEGVKMFIDGRRYAAAQEEYPLRDRIYDSAWAADPVAHVWAGTDFDSPEGLGTAIFNERSIWITRKPLDGLKEILEGHESVERLGEGDNIVYKVQTTQYDWREAKKTYFITFPHDRIALLAESSSELQTMRERLMGEPRALPERWRRVAGGIGIESPVLVLREYAQENVKDVYSPAHPEVRELADSGRAESIAIALPDTKQIRLELNFRGERSAGLVPHMQELAAVFDWKTHMGDDGFVAVLVLQVDAEAGVRSEMVPWMAVMAPAFYAFGYSFMI